MTDTSSATAEARQLAREIGRSNPSDWYDGLEAVADGYGGLLQGLAQSILELDVWEYIDLAEEAGFMGTLDDPATVQFIIDSAGLGR